MSVLIKDMEMPKECHGCRWFYFQGTSCTEPKYYLDARCKMVESGQDWYGKDVHGGWIGESIEHIPGWTGYYQYKHCVEMGTMASQCPLCELPPAQSEIIYCKDCAKHNKDLGSYEVHPDGSSTWIWKDSACPLVSWRGKAQGHEYDYQHCVYAERKVTE